MGEVVAQATERAQRLVAFAADAGPAAGRSAAVSWRCGSRSTSPRWCRRRSRQCSGRGRGASSITIETEVAPARTVGDPRLLERLIGNLVENAIRHNVTGRLASDQLRRDRAAGLAACRQRRRRHPDRPTSISLFEPFRRGGPAEPARPPAGRARAGDRPADRRRAPRAAAGRRSAVRRPGDAHRAARAGTRGRYRDGCHRPPIPRGAGACPPDGLTPPADGLTSCRE